MLISCIGNIGHGKSTIGKILQAKGFEKISFADPLKQYVAVLYGWDLATLYDQEKKEEPLNSDLYIWDKEACERLSNIIGEKIKWNGENIVFTTKRHALQYSGTEILREHDPEFHVKKFYDFVSSKNSKNNYHYNFVNDDCRFKNECDIIKKLGGYLVKVVRPGLKNESSHASEQIDSLPYDFLLYNDQNEDIFMEDLEVKVELILEEIGKDHNLVSDAAWNGFKCQEEEEPVYEDSDWWCLDPVKDH